MSEGNKLNKVQDPLVIQSNLNSVKESCIDVYVWKFVGGVKHLAVSRIEAIRKQRNDFCIVPQEGQDRLLQDLMSGQSNIDLYIPDKALLFRCRVKQTDAPFRYYLEFPDFVAQAERRSSLRVLPKPEDELKISFGKSVTAPRQMSQHFLKPCFDISVGGLSFYVSKTESKFFRIEDIVKDIELKNSNWGTKISFQVLDVRETEPDELNDFAYKAWRVSCKILQIDPVSKKHLERFIFERIKGELHAING